MYSYDEFTIEIHSRPGGRHGKHLALVCAKPDGGRTQPTDADLPTSYVEGLLAAPTRDTVVLGDALGQCMFPPRVLVAFHEALDKLSTQGENTGLRIRLRCFDDEVARWPWELVRVGLPFRAKSRYLLRHEWLSLVRDIVTARPASPPSQRPNLTILTLDATQVPGAAQLIPDFPEETQASSPVRRIMLARPTKASIDAAIEEIVDGMDRLDIFHFTGHGRAPRDGRAGALLVCREDADPDLYSADELAVRLASAGTSLAFINACYSQDQPGPGSGSGIAQALTGVVPVVVAIRGAVEDRAARDFAVEFYRQLLNGATVDEAVASGRAVLDESLQDWARVVLYSQVGKSRFLEPVGPASVVLIYDWEDGHLADGFAKRCEEAGLTVVGRMAAGVPEAVGQIPPEARMAVLWTKAAHSSREVSEAVVSAVTFDRRLLYLMLPDSPPCPVGAAALQLEPLADDPERPELPANQWKRDRLLLRARLTNALELNDGVPFHLLGDKFCAKWQAAEAATSAYHLAVSQFPALDPARLEAVLAYAAVCRFRGEWQRAARLLGDEPLPDRVAGKAYPSAALAITAERLSLAFELGRIGIQGQAKDVLSQALASGEWPLIIVMHRLLGMLAEERGDYRLARDHLDRACHYAEDLLETPFLADRIPSPLARVALRADCLRELAAAEWRAGESALAQEHLTQARQALGLIDDKPATEYLLRVVDYQSARVAYSTEHDYEAALGTLRTSYQSLQRFDNPIRLATVLESVVQLEMEFLRGSDDEAQGLRATLEKIRRVRGLRGHDYMIARTTKSLGDLEFALGRIPEAREQYEHARREFNRLGKYPELAGTMQSVARCEARVNGPAGGIVLLQDFLEQLEELGLHSLRPGIRAEIAWLRSRRVGQDQVIADTEMTDVGEYSVHEWIAGGLLRAVGGHDDGVVVGVGDDGAVLRLGPGEDLIVSTDSVPPRLVDTDSEHSARYAARFAVVSALSDVISMGGQPLAILVNLHLRRTTSASWTRSFLGSVAAEAAHYGAVIAGGDLDERPYKALTVAAVGRVRTDQALTRRGAKPGDLVVLTLSAGPVEEFAGLGTRWAQELAPSLATKEVELIANLIRRDATFTDLGLPHEVMRAIVTEQLANSAIDTSDGILACSQFVSDAAGVGIELFPEALGKFVNPDVTKLARSLGIEPFLFTLNVGYDWEIFLTVPKSQENALRALTQVPRSGYPRAVVIGEVVQRQAWSDEGVYLRTSVGAGTPLRYFTGEKFIARTHRSRVREWLEFAKESTRLVRP